jgi:TPP-dependent pyruvate/acetoin dehydrogenase alpha subunit
MDLKSKAMKISVGIGTTLAAGAAMAQSSGPDVSAATSAFTAAGTAIGTVGAAMVVAAAAGIVYRWVTAFLVK